MSDEVSTTNQTTQAPEQSSEELLRETLKRCPAGTIEAALAFRESQDPSLVPTIVLGIIERFLDPEVIDTLHSGGDSVKFMEDLGLDSLTMMEAVMMVEESLNVSIQNEELYDLRTIGDLKQFISNKVAGIEKDDSVKTYRVEEIAASMPHQDPFLFLIEASISGDSATGSYPIHGQEFFLQGHFKDNPVFPASIMLEALGQLAVFHFMKTNEDQDNGEAASLYFTGADGVRCHRVCKPGETLEMSIKLKRRRDPMVVFSGKITVNGEKAVSADEITLVFATEEQARQNGVEPIAAPSSEMGSNGRR